MISVYHDITEQTVHRYCPQRYLRVDQIAGNCNKQEWVLLSCYMPCYGIALLFLKLNLLGPAGRWVVFKKGFCSASMFVGKRVDLLIEIDRQIKADSLHDCITLALTILKSAPSGRDSLWVLMLEGKLITWVSANSPIQQAVYYFYRCQTDGIWLSGPY